MQTLILRKSFFRSLQIRHILENGTLYFPKFETNDYRQDVHWAIYKCQASNSGGTIISRDLQVKVGKFVSLLVCIITYLYLELTLDLNSAWQL